MMKDEELTSKEALALRSIRNSLVHNGRSPSVRDLMSLLGYKSPRSAAIIIDSLIAKGYIKRKPDGRVKLVKEPDVNRLTSARTVDIPLVGTVACGLPILAEENVEAFIPVSTALAHPGSRYFLLRAKGDSMDKAGIRDGDFVLVRQQPVAEDGDLVVALIDDEATIKEFRRKKNAIVLKPKSSNKKHQPIILTTNFQIQGVVVTTIQDFE